jgi:transcriptional regulator with XRE-family HTH domain
MSREFRASRRAAKLTQGQVAAVMGVTLGRVSQLELGDKWTLEMAESAAAAVGRPLVEMLGGWTLTHEEERAVIAMRSKR